MMLFDYIEQLGLTEQLQEQLNDPVNWVTFINDAELSRAEQKEFRDRLGLIHLFDGEIH